MKHAGDVSLIQCVVKYQKNEHKSFQLGLNFDNLFLFSKKEVKKINYNETIS